MNYQWAAALAALGLVGYFLVRDYEEIEPVEERRGRRRPDGGRLLGVDISALKGSSCPAFTDSQAARARKKVKVPGSVSTKTLRKGMNVEREHASIGACHSPTLAAKIAAAHLRERPDYYTMLAKFEK